MDNLDVEESNKRPYEDDFLENGEEDGVGYSADTSVGVPTPILSPSAVVAKRPAAKKGAKKQKKIKVKFGASSNPGAHGERQELERRRDNFLRAHAKVYLALLPPKNAIANLFTASNKNKVHHESVPYRVVTQPKSIVGGTLKDYQLAGVSFMAYMYENGQNCILADEMGLGKTAQTISLFAYIAEHHNGAKGPHLVICPLSVLGAWMTELARWLPSSSVVRFHGPMSERDRLKKSLKDVQPDVVVTTYEAYTAESTWFKHRRWVVCVLDEGHKIKNHDSQAAQALQGIGATMRIILSGTPLQNNLAELWSLLHFLSPLVFTQATITPFKESFNLSLGLYDQGFIKKSQNLLELIMLRRTKEGVRGELSVPRREEMTLYVPLSPAQRFWYLRLLNRADSMTLSEIFTDEVKQQQQEVAKIEEVSEGVNEAKEGELQVRENIKNAIASNKTGGEGNAWMKMMNLLMQLRKCCNHPYLLPNAESEPFEVAEHLVTASSKLVLLDKILGDILPKGEKVLIFSGFTRMLDILEDFMHLRGYTYARLDGSTSRPRRALDIKLFQQANSPYQIFLISTRAGGLGINLTAATSVVLVDQDWNPQVDIQAISRAHRIGQTKIVQVYRIVCQDSVEEQALTRLRKKLYLSAKVMGTMRNATSTDPTEADDADKTEDDAPRMTRGELASILRGGTSALAKWGTDGTDAFTQFRESTFEDLREKGRLRDEKKEVGIKVDLGESVDERSLKDLEREEEEAERLLLAGREAVQARKFEGNSYKQSNVEIREEWDRTVSRISNARTVIIDGHSVMAETLACKQWEAVKTITSDPEMVKKLANAKKQRKKFEHEDHCMVCKLGGEVYQCASCPRSVHGDCTGHTQAALDAMMTFYCGQHNCTSCSRTTQEAGGLLFRCQVCDVSLCEDCLGTEEIEAIGDVLPEFLVLQYGRRAQAYYIRCSNCVDELRAGESAYSAQWRAEEAATAKKMQDMGLS